LYSEYEYYKNIEFSNKAHKSNHARVCSVTACCLTYLSRILKNICIILYLNSVHKELMNWWRLWAKGQSR